MSSGRPLLIGVGVGGRRILSCLGGELSNLCRVEFVEKGDRGVHRPILSGSCGTVLLLDLGAPDAEILIPSVDELLRTVDATIAVLPFSFEAFAARDLFRRIQTVTSSAGRPLILASRDESASVADEERPLEDLRNLVDVIAASGAATLALVFERGLRYASCPFVSALGAADVAEGGPAEAARRAVRALLLSPAQVALSRHALVAVVSGRPVTLSGARALEKSLKPMLAPDARLELFPHTEPALGERASVAICIELPAMHNQGYEFPSEDPSTLEIPAFIRKRMSCGRSGWLAHWLKTG